MALPKDIRVVVSRNLGELIFLPDQNAVFSKHITATATGPIWEATIEIVIEARRPVVESVSVRRLDGGPEVSSSVLRSVTVASIVRDALTIAAFPAYLKNGQLRMSILPIGDEMSVVADTGKILNSERRARSSGDEHRKLLEEVAREYRMALADPTVKRPRAHVASKLHRSSSHIGKLLGEARRTDPPLLNPAPGPGKAGEIVIKKMSKG